jgi:trimeric autotransporter adhesin
MSTTAQIQEIYVGLLGRAADAEGLAYWKAEIDGGVLTIEQLRANIVNEQPEWQSGLGTLSREDLVKALYDSMFNRAPEAAGLEYWTTGGGSGVNADQLVVAFTKAASTTDRATLDNKTTAATYYTESGVEYDKAEAAAAVADVDSTTASVTASQAATDALKPTLTLTTGADTLTGTAAAEFFNAPILTLGAGDVLDGSAGRDVLNATINGNIAATTRISDIEVINFTGFGERTVDTLNILGAEQIWSVGSTAKLSYTNVADKNIVFGASGASNNDVDVTFQAGTLAGSNDTVKFALRDATAGATLQLVNETAAETVDLTVLGNTNTLSGLTSSAKTVVIRGDANELKVAGTSLDAMTSVVATEFGGDIVGSTIASGFSGFNILGATGGTSLILGNGDHNIKFTSAMTGAGSNVINLGNGDNTLDFISVATHGDSYIFGGSGDDVVRISGQVAMRSGDLISLGGGDDTLVIANKAAAAPAITNALVLQGVENLVIAHGADGTTNTVSVADSALAVNVEAGSGGTATGAAIIQGLTKGSTVAVNNAKDATAGLDALTAKFAATEAASTIVLNAKMGVNAGASAGMVTTDKISALTINAADTLGDNAGDTIVATAATSLTINAAKAVNAAIADATTNKLKTITVNGSDAVTLGNTGNVADLETVSVTGVKNVALATIAGTKLKDVTVSSSAGNATLSTVGTTTTSAIDVTVSGAKAATLGTGTVTADAVNTTAGKVGDISVIASDGALNSGVINATDLGTLTYTASNGAISAGAINANDATGIVVNMSAKTGNISNNGAGQSAVVVTNAGGGITASLAGDAAATVNYVVGAATKGVVNLTATNTGGLTSTITNQGTADKDETSTIVLGNAGTDKTNSITLGGTVDNVIVTGGTGADTIAFSTANDFKSLTLNLGLGDNTVDFTEIAASTGASITAKGLAINLSNDDYTFKPNTANATTVKASTAVQYDSGADKNVVSNGFTADLGGGSKGVISTVVGTEYNDFIIANNAGSVIGAGDGNDTVVLGAGADVVVYGSQLGGTAVTAAADKIDITNFTTTGGVLDKLSFGTGAAAATTANTAVVATVASDSTAADFVTNLETAIDGATGTTGGQQVVLIKAISGDHADVLTNEVLEDALTASDLTGAVYVIIVDDASTARVLYDGVAETDAGDGVVLVGTITGTAMGSIGLDNILFGA